MLSNHYRISAKALPLLLVLLVAGMHQLAFAKGNNDGYIYGKVTTRSGSTYTGSIRWGTEETFWDDLFNSVKTKLPYQKYVEKFGKKKYINERQSESNDIAEKAEQIAEEARKKNDEELRESARELREQARALKAEALRMAEEARSHSRSISIFDGTIRVNWNDFGASRIFVARFGDIKEIKVTGSEDAEITTKDNEVYAVSGGSNDVGANIIVRDNTLGEITVPWKKIDKIEFDDTPKYHLSPASRMYGTVTAESGVFTGFVQWDCEECLSIDKLDGDSEDGRMSIQMGSIRTIEKKNRKSCKVETKDGRKLVLDGTNDVEESNRGIMVEVPNTGRITIPFECFEKVVFSEPPGTGKGYSEYRIPKPLRGTVTDSDGKIFSGRMVFDIDEAYSWEMLNGKSFDIDYAIPFENVKSLTPTNDHASEVWLKGGTKINLEDTQDVSSNNSGMLVFNNGEKENPTYVDWKRIKKIDFE